MSESTSETMSELVTYTLAGDVASIVMDDGKANALSIAMLAELHAAFDRAESDGAVVVLAGRDGRFTGGFHLPTLRARGEEAGTMLRSGFDLAVRILTFPMPVVVACTGHAVAQGAILLCSADERIGAAGPYTITLNEAAIGLVVARSMIEIGRHRLNPSHVHRVFTLAEAYSPDRAVEAGFLDRVVPPDDVLAVALDAARGYASLDRKAHGATKARVQEDMLRRLRVLIDEEFPAGARGGNGR
jgi:enoyl-CoA hydratase/carnithine racemase